MGELPLAPVERIIRDNAHAQRVSASATRALAQLLEKHGALVAVRAKKMAQHAGRKTVRGEDVKLAVKRSRI